MPSPAFRLVLISAMAVGCAAEPSVSRNLQDRSLARESHRVYLPEQYDAARSWPLVLLLHGYTANAGLMNYYLGMSQRTSEHGFILVTPEGTKNSAGHQFWNATDFCCDFEDTGIDDVAYLEDLVAEVQRDYNVDSRAIHAIGHSNGGFMANTLACDESGIFAGIVNIAGSTFTDAATCRASRPVSVLQIHAVDDPTVRYEGSPQEYPGARETQQRWAQLDGCDATPEEGEAIDAAASLPGAETTPLLWKNCEQDVRVELWTIRAKQPDDPVDHMPHVPRPAADLSDRLLNFLLRR
jgi:polyhydroxybutyrate depolymerase